MRVNKIIKSLALALPILALAACSSSSDESADSQVDNNMSAQTTQQTQDNVQVAAAQRAAEIKEQKRQQLAQLRSEHIVYFGFDKSNVSSKFSSVLEAHANFLNSNADVNVIIEGHADERGTPEYNIALGERRAKAVVTFLQNMGVSASQLTLVSYGEEKAMVKDRSEAAFDKNRRAVLIY